MHSTPNPFTEDEINFRDQLSREKKNSKIVYDGKSARRDMVLLYFRFESTLQVWRKRVPDSELATGNAFLTSFIVSSQPASSFNWHIC